MHKIIHNGAQSIVTSNTGDNVQYSAVFYVTSTLCVNPQKEKSQTLHVAS